jgi:hypothetical protein
MRDKSDFPRGNFSSEFCADCVDEKGCLKSRSIIRENMIKERVEKRGLSMEEAAESVDNLMKYLPMWSQQPV